MFSIATGVSLQLSAKTIADAKARFHKSCELCCFSGMNIPCKNCHVAGAYEQVVNSFKCLSAKQKH